MVEFHERYRFFAVSGLIVSSPSNLFLMILVNLFVQPQLKALMVERELTYDDRFEGSNDEVGEDEEVKGLQILLFFIILCNLCCLFNPVD